jgi:hypothetical protein
MTNGKIADLDSGHRPDLVGALFIAETVAAQPVRDARYRLVSGPDREK